MVADEILTDAEVADDLRCSKAHVYNMINGKVTGVMPLPAITMGAAKASLPFRPRRLPS
jgi:hypothetical protein